jgi:carboxypeptidase PM20D1
MKRYRSVLFIVLGLFLIILCFVLANSFFAKSKQVSAIADEYQVSDAAVERLSKAITYKTITPAIPENRDSLEFIKFQTFIDSCFSGVSAQLLKESFGLSLLYTWQGKNKDLKPILLMAHQDVVPVDDSLLWEVEPFSGKVKDGFIYGRGALDIKSGVMGLLEAIEALIQEDFMPERTIYLVFGHDEESGEGTGSASIADALKERNIQLEYVLDEGGLILENALPGLKQPLALIGVAEKGYMNIQMTAKGEGGHSSMPGSETTVAKLAEAIEKVSNKPFPARIDGPVHDLFAFSGPEMDFPLNLVFTNTWLFSNVIIGQMSARPSSNAILRTTLAFTMLKGSSKENVLPSEASAIANLRLMPGMTDRDVIQTLTEIVQDTSIHIEVLNYQPASPVSKTDSKAFQEIQKSIKAVFPTTNSAPFLLVALTDSKHFVEIADNVYRFHPAIYTNDDLKRLHGNNERIGLENYKKSIAFYRKLILESNQ